MTPPAQYLPIECTEMVVLFLPPLDRFKAATCLRLLYIQNQTMALVPALSQVEACSKGYVDLLERWKSIKPEQYHGVVQHSSFDAAWYLMDIASGYGHVHVLEWLKTNYHIIWTSEAIDRAASPAVLEWWKNSQLSLYYTRQAMDNATCTGRIDILQWWLESGLELRYSGAARLLSYDLTTMDQVKEWWRNSKLLGASSINAMSIIERMNGNSSSICIDGRCQMTGNSFF